MGKLLKVAAVVVVLLIGWQITQKVGSNQLESSANAVVTETVASLNAQLPQQVGPGITLTKVELLGNTVRNTYSMDSTVPFDPRQRSAYEANAVTQVCGSMLEMSKNGFTVDFRYEYKESGVPKTFDISVPPSKCA